jgi:hypothetical protein
MTRPNVDEDYDSVAALYARMYDVVSAITHWILALCSSLSMPRRCAPTAQSSRRGFGHSHPTAQRTRGGGPGIDRACAQRVLAFT